MHGKSREGMGNPGKAWDILGKHWKSRDSMENPGKAWKIPGKHGKSWGNLPGKAVKTREIPGFFSSIPLKS